MKYRVYTYGHPVLRQPAEKITGIGDSIVQLSKDMLSTMREEKGLGLAAQQIGKTISICVIDIPSDYDLDEQTGKRLNPDISAPLILINPVILEKSGTIRQDEGCLSFPEIYGPVQRAREILLSYIDLPGAERRIELRGMAARAVQHELDHLDGVLFVDKLSTITKIGMASRLKRLKEETKDSFEI